MNSLSLASNGLLKPGRAPSLAIAAQGLLVLAAATRRGGDDAPGARERFWRAKQDEWEEQALKRVAQAVSKPRKARKRFVADFLQEIESDAVAASFGPSRIDGIIAALSQPAPDYTALAAVVAAHLAEIEAERVKRRRKRDLEAVLMLAA